MASYEELILILGVLGSVSFLAWLVARFATERARERERRSQFLEAKLERLATAREFIEFAKSEAGLNWLRADSGERKVRQGILVLILVGVLSASFAIAFLVYAFWFGSAVDPNDTSTRANSAWWGAVFAGLGLGGLLAASVLARIGRSWGLLSQNKPDQKQGE